MYYCELPDGLFRELAFIWMVTDAIPYPMESAIMSPRGACCCYTIQMNSKGTFQGEEGGPGRKRSVPSRYKAEMATMWAIRCAIQ